MEQNDLATIKNIGDANLADLVNKQLKDSGFNAIALTDGLSLQSTEQFLDTPVEFKGNFETSIISEFANYSNDQEESTVFISNTDIKAYAIFDFGKPGSPLNRMHKAYLNLEATADYCSLLDGINSSFTQKGLAMWVEEYHANLKAFGKEALVGGTPPNIELSKALNAIRNSKVKVQAEIANKIEDLSESTSTFASIDLANDEGNHPAYLEFTCTPYHGLFLPLQADNQEDDENMKRTFRIRISTITNEEKLTFSLKIMNKEAHEEAIIQAFKTQLKDELDDETTVRIGKFFD